MGNSQYKNKNILLNDGDTVYTSAIVNNYLILGTKMGYIIYYNMKNQKSGRLQIKNKDNPNTTDNPISLTIISDRFFLMSSYYSSEILAFSITNNKISHGIISLDITTPLNGIFSDSDILWFCNGMGNFYSLNSKTNKIKTGTLPDGLYGEVMYKSQMTSGCFKKGDLYINIRSYSTTDDDRIGIYKINTKTLKLETLIMKCHISTLNKFNYLATIDHHKRILYIFNPNCEKIASVNLPNKTSIFPYPSLQWVTKDYLFMKDTGTNTILIYNNITQTFIKLIKGDGVTDIFATIDNIGIVCKNYIHLISSLDDIKKYVQVMKI